MWTYSNVHERARKLREVEQDSSSNGSTSEEMAKSQSRTDEKALEKGKRTPGKKHDEYKTTSEDPPPKPSPPDEKKRKVVEVEPQGSAYESRTKRRKSSETEADASGKDSAKNQSVYVGVLERSRKLRELEHSDSSSDQGREETKPIEQGNETRSSVLESRTRRRRGSGVGAGVEDDEKKTKQSSRPDPVSEPRESRRKRGTEEIHQKRNHEPDRVPKDSKMIISPCQLDSLPELSNAKQSPTKAKTVPILGGSGGGIESSGNAAIRRPTTSTIPPSNPSTEKEAATLSSKQQQQRRPESHGGSDLVSAFCKAFKHPRMNGLFSPCLHKIQKDIERLIEKACEGSNQSCLVMGPNGSGKTAVVYEAIRSVSLRLNAANEEAKKHREPKKPFAKGQPSVRQEVLCVVRLNGLLHASESVSFLETARQLDGALCVSLSAISSSKPVTVENDQLARLNQLQSLSIHEQLEIIQKSIEAISEHGMTVIFVLDAFEKFAVQDPLESKLSLNYLYCVLNLLQGRQVRGALIGLTARIDAADILEKRVKSRFSGNILRTVFPPDLDEIITYLDHRLCSCVDDDPMWQPWKEGFFKSVHRFFQSPTVKQSFEHMFQRTHSMEYFLECMSLVCSDMRLDPPVLNPSSIRLALNLHGTFQDPIAPLLDLSVLELLLLYALKRKIARVKSNTLANETKSSKEVYRYSFQDVYSELRNASTDLISENLALAGANPSGSAASGLSTDIFDEHIAWKAFERLLELQMIRCMHEPRKLKSQQSLVLLVREDEVDAAMKKHPEISFAAQHWVSKE